MNIYIDFLCAHYDEEQGKEELTLLGLEEKITESLCLVMYSCYGNKKTLVKELIYPCLWFNVWDDKECVAICKNKIDKELNKNKYF